MTKTQTLSNLNPETIKKAQSVRAMLEKEGYKLTDMEYDIILTETVKKASIGGKAESYIPLLLEDEIKDYFFRSEVNAITFVRTHMVEI